MTPTVQELLKDACEALGEALYQWDGWHQWTGLDPCYRTPPTTTGERIMSAPRIVWVSDRSFGWSFSKIYEEDSDYIRIDDLRALVERYSHVEESGCRQLRDELEALYNTEKGDD